MITRICPICGTRFEAVDRRRKYCSRRCRDVALERKNRILSEFPSMPEQALDLTDAACTLRHVGNEIAALGAVSPPEVAVICYRLSDGVAALLDSEGL